MATNVGRTSCRPQNAQTNQSGIGLGLRAAGMLAEQADELRAAGSEDEPGRVLALRARA